MARKLHYESHRKHLRSLELASGQSGLEQSIATQPGLQYPQLRDLIEVAEVVEGKRFVVHISYLLPSFTMMREVSHQCVQHCTASLQGLY